MSGTVSLRFAAMHKRAVLTFMLLLNLFIRMVKIRLWRSEPVKKLIGNSKGPGTPLIVG
ncbi:hypothetical protein [Chryseobacterium gregarium]|uniref:hypothetical protein n=1 Tax=Chryseobacterium gregarium TaxID=456299 RepID=UPI00040D73F6|nr:hypothetical protein [Chryseobacterium gregarium]